MFATIVMTLLILPFMVLVIMIIVYFDYILSIARLSSYSSISSYNARSGVHGVSGRYCVSVVLIRCLLADAPNILGHVVDHGCDTPVESFVVHSLNIGIQVGSSYCLHQNLEGGSQKLKSSQNYVSKESIACGSEPADSDAALELASFR